MKMVIAFIQPFMAQQVVHALHRVPGLTGASFTEVKGVGRGRPTDAPSAEALYGTSNKVRVEVMVREDIADAVVRALHEGAQTGKRGDGKIYVLPVERAVRIATGEEGADGV